MEDWIRGWDFATSGFLIGEVVLAGITEAYKDHFVTKASNYPRAWWISCQAEWQLRFEWAVAEQRRQEEFHERNPASAATTPGGRGAPSS